MPLSQSDNNRTRITKNVLHFMQSQDKNGTWNIYEWSHEANEDIGKISSMVWENGLTCIIR